MSTIFVDDIIIFTLTWQQHIDTLRATVTEIKGSKSDRKTSKVLHWVRQYRMLGTHVSEGTLQPCQDKINSILHAERPTTKKQVRSFFGLVGFYRQFIKNFSELAAPLTELTKKGQRNQDIKWGESQEKAFNQLRQALVSKPILKMVEISKPFTLQVDAV